MRSCLIWRTGVNFVNNYYLIQYYEQSGQIKIVGITSNESFYENVLGYPFVEKNDIDVEKLDLLIIMSSKQMFQEIKNEAVSKGISEEKIVPIYVMALPGFDFEKYICLKKDIPTIFAPNCWGGITYNSLGLEFKSPLINMFMDHTDYIKFLRNPSYYLECQLSFERKGYENILKKDYPIVRCGDILLYCNHYSTFEDVLLCWNRRKERINWSNIVAMFYDEDAEKINEFCELPYKKKFCFVSYVSDNKMHIGINYRKREYSKNLGQIVNGTANGTNLYYDVFDLLLYNKVNPLVKI